MGKRITRRELEAAARDYAWALSNYGEATLETSRRLGRWQEAQRQWEAQTGKPAYDLGAR